MVALPDLAQWWLGNLTKLMGVETCKPTLDQTSETEKGHAKTHYLASCIASAHATVCQLPQDFTGLTQ